MSLGHKIRHNFVSAILSAAIAVGAVESYEHFTAKSAAVEQPAFAHVMASHTIRCAYMAGGPALTINPNNNNKSGIAYDVFEQVGRMLGLQVVWLDEVPPARIAGALASGKYDALCMTLWPTGDRAAGLDFTVPLDYVGVSAYARADDARFDGNLAKINDPEITIAVSDDSYGQAVANEDFARARQYNVLEEGGAAAVFLAVTRQKADVVFADPFAAGDFMKNNPGTIKQVSAPPVRMFGGSYAVAKGETKLRDMLNVALEQLNQNGFTRAALDKYMGDHKGQYLYPAKPWEP